jgi:SNF2 family DNA or RNA helicase
MHAWLVLCPLILIENAWLEDARMFPTLSVVSLHDATRAKRLKKFEQKSNVYISNIESFIDYEDLIRKLPIHGCIVDESSTMKSSSSKFGKAAVEYSRDMKRWYLLSGTPAPNGEWEYYRQLQSVDFYGVHKSWSQFKTHFFNNVSRSPQYEKLETKPERQDELIGLLKQYSLYVDKEDVLKTPGRDFETVEFSMPEDLSNGYHKLRQELYMELGDSVLITAPGAAAKLNKLNQISSGFIIDTSAIKRNKYHKENNITTEGMEEESYLLSEYRFKILYDLLDKLGDKQAIIWANYHKEFEIIQKHFGSRCGCVYGEVGIAEKNENIRKFKEGKIQYLIANPASADKGLTLTNAHIAIYFSLGYSYELWKQSIERIYGDIIKQKNRCTYYIFIAKGTVDRTIYNTVSTKGNMSMAILNHLKGGL